MNIRLFATLIKASALCAGVFLASLSSAELYLIAHQESGIQSLSSEQVRDLYMGRYIVAVEGKGQLKPVDQEDDVVRRDFYQAISGKSLRQINSYWARLVFSGRGRPPQKISHTQVVESVSNGTDVVGYISSLDLIEGRPVSVIHTITYR